MFKVEPYLMLRILRFLVMVRWVELAGPESLSIYEYFQPGFDKRPKDLMFLALEFNLRRNKKSFKANENIRVMGENNPLMTNSLERGFEIDRKVFRITQMVMAASKYQSCSLVIMS